MDKSSSESGGRISGRAALERLRQGNRRFASGDGNFESHLDRAWRDQLVRSQSPIAAILGCSDSRVPVEIIFDQGLGDLFVIRVAGNIVAPSQIGSIEFAVENLGTRLVVVLGHTHCGALEATLKALQDPGEGSSPHLQSIVNRVRPSLEGILAGEHGHDSQSILHEAVRANVRSGVVALSGESTLLRERIAEDDLLVVGAVYSLETGLVEFVDDRESDPGNPSAGGR